MTVHPIEQESYRILAERVDLSRYGPLGRAVVSRVIHASADTEFAESISLDEQDLEMAVRALRRDSKIIADVEMVRAGITGAESLCYLDQTRATPGITRSAAAIRLAASEHPQGAIFVIGCAPTALSELVSLGERRVVEPSLVIGMPVGFVGAAQAKAALRESSLPSVSNEGEKGGSAVAAAVLNALVRIASPKDYDNG